MRSNISNKIAILISWIDLLSSCCSESRTTAGKSVLKDLNSLLSIYTELRAKERQQKKNAYARARYHADPDAHKTYQAQWRADNPARAALHDKRAQLRRKVKRLAKKTLVKGKRSSLYFEFMKMSLAINPACATEEVGV